MRSDSNRPLVGELRERIGVLVEQNLAVRLVADQEDFGPELGRLRPQQLGQRLDQRSGIHRARGIVGRVDDHQLGPRRELALKLVQVGNEVAIAADHHRLRPVVGRVKQVLGEERRQDHDLVVAVAERVHDHVERRRRADGHDDVIGTVGEAGLVRQRVGDRLPGLDVAGVGHVAMHARRVRGGEAAQFVEELRRRFGDRIAQREVEDVLGPALLSQLDAQLEHPPNPGAVLHCPLNISRNRHHRPSRLPLAVSSAGYSSTSSNSSPNNSRLYASISSRIRRKTSVSSSSLMSG